MKVVMMTTKVETVWQRFGSLINTGLIVVGAIGLVVTWAKDSEKRDQAIRDNAGSIERLEVKQQQKWDEHAELHKSRLSEVSATNGRYDERFKNVENELRKLTSVSENTVYRVTSAENNLTSLNTTMKEIQNLLSQQSGDLREIKVILQGNPPKPKN